MLSGIRSAIPVAVLAVALLISAGGAYGATQVDTTFSTDDFLSEEPPEWSGHLPASLEPCEYTAADTIAYLDDTFVRQEMRTQILVEGDPTDPDTIARVDEAEARAANASTTAELPNGDPAVRGPLATMERVAAENESFNETYAAADTDGDGVPDSDLEAVYDDLFAADEEAAAAVVHRTGEVGERSSTDGQSPGEYEALRVVAFADGDATRGDVTGEVRAVADDVDGGGVTATATGQQTVLYHIVEEEILDTVVRSLLLTLVAVGALLTVASRVTSGSATLGLATTLPVVLALSWILGTMYALGLSFNAVTGMITSLTVGLGVAYSIHVTQRYHQELSDGESAWRALRTTVTGTGGALLGSAATTAGGFGVLAFSFLPSLQQFGIITAMSIVYAFLASVLVLPSVLVLWTRTFGPDWAAADLASRPTPGRRPREAGSDD